MGFCPAVVVPSPLNCTECSVHGCTVCLHGQSAVSYSELCAPKFLRSSPVHTPYVILNHVQWAVGLWCTQFTEMDCNGCNGCGTSAMTSKAHCTNLDQFSQSATENEFGTQGYCTLMLLVWRMGAVSCRFRVQITQWYSINMAEPLLGISQILGDNKLYLV